MTKIFPYILVLSFLTASELSAHRSHCASENTMASCHETGQCTWVGWTGVNLVGHQNISCFANDGSDRDKLGYLLRHRAKSDSKFRVEFRESPEAILDYMDLKIADGLLRDPSQFLHDWTERRGITREHRVPEDPARYILSTYLYNFVHKDGWRNCAEFTEQTRPLDCLGH
jgi:hypothetical protein